MYLSENLVVDYPLQMIGAGKFVGYSSRRGHLSEILALSAPGKNVAQEVTIEKHTGSTIHFTEGAHGAYLGYCTIRVSLFDVLSLTTRLKL